MKDYANRKWATKDSPWYASKHWYGNISGAVLVCGLLVVSVIGMSVYFD